MLSSTTPPAATPPVVAVYVAVSVTAVPAVTDVGATFALPAPSAELLTATVGEAPIAARPPPAVDCSRVVHVPVPDCAALGASALSYVIVSVAPASSVTPLTVIVWPETETVPVELVV